MPGLSGLETLIELKSKRSDLPVIMITKSEEESIMEEAIGSKISDYLIKPVNPNQILLSIKSILIVIVWLVRKRTQTTEKNLKIGLKLGGNISLSEWKDLFKKITFWELELQQSGDDGMTNSGNAKS